MLKGQCEFTKKDCSKEFSTNPDYKGFNDLLFRDDVQQEERGDLQVHSH